MNSLVLMGFFLFSVIALDKVGATEEAARWKSLGADSPVMNGWLNAQSGRRFYGYGDAWISLRSPFRRTMRNDSFDSARANVKPGAKWGTGKGGPRRVELLYDPALKVVAYTIDGDSWSESVVEYAAGPPPVELPKADLSTFSSRLGIRLGSRRSDIYRIFGRTPTRYDAKNGFSVVAYERRISKDGPGCYVYLYSFGFKKDRAALIVYSKGSSACE